MMAISGRRSLDRGRSSWKSSKRSGVNGLVRGGQGEQGERLIWAKGGRGEQGVGELEARELEGGEQVTKRN